MHIRVAISITCKKDKNQTMPKASEINQMIAMTAASFQDMQIAAR